MTMQDISNLPKDTLVEGNRIVKKIGTGYTGIVYRAFDDAKRRDVALKFLKKPEKEYDRIAQRFKDEYQRQLIGKVHPNIAEVYQFGSLEGQLFFTSEFADGYNIYICLAGDDMFKGGCNFYILKKFIGFCLCLQNALMTVYCTFKFIPDI